MGSCLLLRKRNASKLVATRIIKQEMVRRIGTARPRVLVLPGTNRGKTFRSGSEGQEGAAEALLYSGTLSGGELTDVVAMRGRITWPCSCRARACRSAFGTQVALGFEDE